MTAKLVGRPTAHPIAKLPANLCGKPCVKPVINRVIVRVMVKSMAKVINSAKSNGEYFLLTFKITTSLLIEHYENWNIKSFVGRHVRKNL